MAAAAERVRAGLHYIAINLVASLLFLIGVALLYGVTGTLNMADIAQKLPLVPASDRGLLHAGAAILAIAFLAKAALWPLNFWLPPAYAAAGAPVAALFAILTKVGVYAVLRLWTLCFPASAGAVGAVRRRGAGLGRAGDAGVRRGRHDGLAAARAAWPASASSRRRARCWRRSASTRPRSPPARCSTWPARRWPAARCSCWSS